LPTEPIFSKNRDTASSSTHPVAPDDILFNRKGARIRFAEEGDYVGIDDMGPIPPSDLLETMHRYVSRFYDRPDVERKHLHYKSMDGTALLALGILLEETLKHSLSKTGHLAFLAAENEDEIATPLGWDGHAWVKKISRQAGTTNERFESAHIDGIPVDDSSEEEQSDNQTNNDEEHDSSSPEAVSKMKERTASPENSHPTFFTSGRIATVPLLSRSDYEDIENTVESTASSRRLGDRRSRRVFSTKGYKSVPLVASSDEDDDEMPELPVSASRDANNSDRGTAVSEGKGYKNSERPHTKRTSQSSASESEPESGSESESEPSTASLSYGTKDEEHSGEQTIESSDEEEDESEREQIEDDNGDEEEDGSGEEESSEEDDSDDKECSEDEEEKKDSDVEKPPPPIPPAKDKQAKFKRDMDAVLARLMAE
jgi:hypothetical protein